jgi:hypothetical protein
VARRAGASAWSRIAVFIGALLAWLFFKLSAARAERYHLAVPIGFMAGDSLMAMWVCGARCFNVLQVE